MTGDGGGIRVAIRPLYGHDEGTHMDETETVASLTGADLLNEAASVILRKDADLRWQAVAHWLHDAAHQWEADARSVPFQGDTLADFRNRRALSVARAYLGLS